FNGERWGCQFVLFCTRSRHGHVSTFANRDRFSCSLTTARMSLALPPRFCPLCSFSVRIEEQNARRIAAHPARPLAERNKLMRADDVVASKDALRGAKVTKSSGREADQPSSGVLIHKDDPAADRSVLCLTIRSYALVGGSKVDLGGIRELTSAVRPGEIRRQLKIRKSRGRGTAGDPDAVPDDVSGERKRPRRL